jgi:hypothetical protein
MLADLIRRKAAELGRARGARIWLKLAVGIAFALLISCGGSGGGGSDGGSSSDDTSDDTAVWGEFEWDDGSTWAQ